MPDRFPGVRGQTFRVYEPGRQGSKMEGRWWDKAEDCYRLISIPSAAARTLG